MARQVGTIVHQVAVLLAVCRCKRIHGEPFLCLHREKFKSKAPKAMLVLQIREPQASISSSTGLNISPSDRVGVVSGGHEDHRKFTRV